MNMDDKLRRAFRRATPNILSSLPRESAAPVKKRRRLSPKFTEFVATAAAIALLVSAVGGTAGYLIRQYSSGGLGPAYSTGESANTPTQPEPVDTHPSNTTPAVTDPAETFPFNDLDAHIAWLKEFSAGLVSQEEELEVTVTAEGEELFWVNVSHHGYLYEFTFDRMGMLLDILILPTENEKEGYISQAVAEEIALLRARQNGNCTLWASSLEEPEEGEPCYLVAIQSTDGLWAAEYRIDACTGAVFDTQVPNIPTDVTAEVAARDLALQESGYTLDDVRCLKISSENPGEYLVYFEVEDKVIALLVDVLSASIAQEFDPAAAPNRDHENAEGIISWKTARDLCFDADGYAAANLIGMNYELYMDTPQVYSDVTDFYIFELHFIDGSASYWIDARTGAFIDTTISEFNPDNNGTAVPEDPDGIIPLDQFTEAALEYVGASSDQITDFSYKYDTRDPSNYRYWIYFAFDGQFYEIAVNAYSLDILECNVYE